MKYLFILNPNSGLQKNPQSLIDQIDSIFRSSHNCIDFELTTGPHLATEISAEAAKNNYDVVVAAGGDGTVNEVASGLINSNTALGVLPLGSGNGVARSYNIPLSFRESVKNLLNPNIITVDAGKIDNRYFVGVCGIGFDAVIAYQFQKFGIRGPIPYFIVGSKSFLKFKPERIQLDFEEKQMTLQPLLITFANTSQYGNSAIIAPHANPSDGYLDVCILDHMPVLKTAINLRRLFDGSILKMPGYSSFRVKSIKITSQNESGYFHVDGEPFEKPAEVKISALPEALNICAGKTFINQGEK